MSAGDFVTVAMARNDCFGLGLPCIFKATILHVPVDTGDMWHIRVDLKENKTVVIAINPTSIDFVGIVLPPVGG